MTLLAIDLLRRDGGTQPRNYINEDVVRDYADTITSGGEFPPVTVFYDGTDYWLADGFHRAAAHLACERKEITSDIRQGTLRDAVLFSVGANASHGLRRTNEDKRRAVEKLLNDEEWAQWSDREIARRCSVSKDLVRKLRTNLTGYKASDNGEQSRKYTTKHGTTAEMNIANIGGDPRPSVARDIEPVTFDPNTGKWNDPWEGTRRQENTRRMNFSLDIIKTLEMLANFELSPQEACDEFFEQVSHDVEPSLDAAVQWLNEFSQIWRSKKCLMRKI